jgi:hypothetical protein
MVGMVEDSGPNAALHGYPTERKRHSRGNSTERAGLSTACKGANEVKTLRAFLETASEKRKF